MTRKDSIKYLILFVLSVMASSCNNGTGNTNRAISDTSVYSVSDTIYADSEGNRYKYLGQIPDSLYTPEQKELVRRLDEIILKYTKAKDNHMALELTKEQFLAMGIPIRYYIILKKNIQENNNFMDTSGTAHIEEMIRKRNVEIYKKLNEFKK